MVNIIKDKEEVKSVMNIIQAFADGKTIQAIDPYDDEWCNQTKLNFEALFEGQYRIKPEPKYRPFNSAEECWQEIRKHDTFIKYKVIESSKDVYLIIQRIKTDGIETDVERLDFETAFEWFTFADGTPFGVKVEK